MPDETTDTLRFATKAVHAGVTPEPVTGAIMTPIFQTSTYVQPALGEHRGFEYARTRNPTRDALAEALAEWLHERTRKELWGYASDEVLSNEELIAEQYQGIRPAMGYPASPDHTEKDLLWELLEAEKHTGIWLTESKAMVPTAAVSGLYFAHPKARYFAVGKINKDQVADYAARKHRDLKEMERWLGPNLAYEPDDV